MDGATDSPVEIFSDDDKTTLKLREGAGLSTIAEVMLSARQAVDRGLPISLDVSELSFLDTPLVQLLISLRETCRAKEISFSPQEPDPSVLNYLRVGGLSKLFPICEA